MSQQNKTACLEQFDSTRIHHCVKAVYALSFSAVAAFPIVAWAEEPVLALADVDHKKLVLAEHQPIKQAKFDPQLLRLSSVYPMVDISKFATGDVVPPGKYLVDVFVNQRWRQNTLVQFKLRDDSDQTDLCVTKELLHLLQLDDKVLNRSVWSQVEPMYCGPLSELIPGLSYAFKMSTLKLTINVPQALLSDYPDQYVPPQLWDKGDFAAYIDYNANSYWRKNDGEASRNDQSIGVRAGIHIGSWALRHSGYYNKPAHSDGEYQNNSFYLQTEWAALRSQMKVGDFYSYGQFMEGMKIRGVEFRTDDRMLPARWRGYAPVVRGVALSNAKVTVRQQDRIIYEGTVPPGEFAIRDLFPLGYGGDLQVTVTETDGREVKYTVPFSSVAQLIRPGFAYYSLSAGKVHRADGVGQDLMWQGSLQYGLTNYLTANAAVQLYPDYLAMMLGAAINTPIGAFALDATQTRANLAQGQRETGHHFKINYNKYIQTTGTDVYVTGYRYSREGYHQLNEFITDQENGLLGESLAWGRKKNQVQLSISQSLSEAYGAFYLSGSIHDNWGHSGHNKELQLGYSNRYKRLNYNLSYQKAEDAQSGKSQNRLMLTLSLPFEVMTRPQYVSLSHNRSSENSSYTQLALSGSLDEASKWHYSANLNRSQGDYNTSVATDYRTGQGSLSASASYDKTSKQASVGASGAVVLHRHGLSLAESLGESFAVVYAKGAEGAGVRNATGTRLNRFGAAVVPYVTPYEFNEISLNPENTSFDVSLKQTAKQIVPRANTVSLVTFATETGRAVFFLVKDEEGKALPMGADVLDEHNNSIGFVSQGGRVFLKGIPNQGRFSVRWGKDADQQCVADYQLQEVASSEFYEQQTLSCKRLAEPMLKDEHE